MPNMGGSNRAVTDTMVIRMRELAVQGANSTVNDRNREAIEAEVSQLKQEIDRQAQSTVYNDQTILTGFGARADEDQSTALTDTADTGVTRVSISGSPTGTYTFVDDAGDGQITLGNGTISQTIKVSTLLDTGGNVATDTTIVANFDRLGAQVTLAGHNASDKTTGSYVDGDLNGKTVVITGGTGGSFQVGADDRISDRLEANLPDMRASGLFLNLNTLSMTTLQSSRSAIGQLDQVIDKISGVRADIGALTNRLQYTISFTENSIENNTNSEGTLRDADMAKEITDFTTSQVTTQAATSMLANANLIPQAVIGLISN